MQPVHVTTLVKISDEAKGIYRPGQRAAGVAGSEPLHRLDQSDRISCTVTVKPLRALGANSISCVCMAWVGVKQLACWPVGAMSDQHARKGRARA